AGAAAPGASGTMVLSRYPLASVNELPMALGGWTMTVSHPQGPVGVVAAHTVRPQEGVDRWHADHDLVRSAALELGETAGAPVVVLGDLNATPDHSVLDEYADAGLRRASRVAGS